MHGELLIAVLAGLGGMIGWGAADFFAKKTTDAVGSITSLVWAHIFGTILIGIVALYDFLYVGNPGYFPINWGVLFGLILFGALQCFIYFLVYEAFKKGQVSVLNPIFATFTGIVAIISFTFFKESVGVLKIVSLLITFFGIVLINSDSSTFVHRKFIFAKVPGFKEIAIATILAAIWTISWDRFVIGENWIYYTLYMYLFMTASAVFLASALKTSLRVKEKSIWKYFFFIGLGETVAYLSITLGYSSTSLTSIVALVSGAFSLPTILLAHIFLKERVPLIQRVGTLVIISGIILLSVVQ
jgi:drug/metabolite transporter (DMT)-like permease